MDMEKIKTVIKYFLYVILFMFVFSLFILFGMFISGNTHVFEWDGFGRFIIVLVSIFTTIGFIGYHETEDE